MYIHTKPNITSTAPNHAQKGHSLKTSPSSPQSLRSSPQPSLSPSSATSKIFLFFAPSTSRTLVFSITGSMSVKKSISSTPGLPDLEFLMSSSEMSEISIFFGTVS